MTRDEATEHVCATVALVYQTLDEYRDASDGFCRRCLALHGASWTYANQGGPLRYVRLAVLEKLKRDGHEIAKGFDPNTGEERPEASDPS